MPATDDEVMQVEDLLEDDKSEIHTVADTGQNVGCASSDGFPSSNSQFDGSEGQPMYSVPFHILLHSLVLLFFFLGGGVTLLYSRLSPCLQHKVEESSLFSYTGVLRGCQTFSQRF